jgi:putative membrane protein insertion efficiency factor
MSIEAALVAAIRMYRLLFSAWLGAHCRFEPTCSRYALEAIERHGAGPGTYLAARRLLRCHPGCSGGHDPVPERLAYRIKP